MHSHNNIVHAIKSYLGVKLRALRCDNTASTPEKFVFVPIQKSSIGLPPQKHPPLHSRIHPNAKDNPHPIAPGSPAPPHHHFSIRRTPTRLGLPPYVPPFPWSCLHKASPMGGDPKGPVPPNNMRRSIRPPLICTAPSSHPHSRHPWVAPPGSRCKGG